jgi:hypothetical protein
MLTIRRQGEDLSFKLIALLEGFFARPAPKNSDFTPIIIISGITTGCKQNAQFGLKQLPVFNTLHLTLEIKQKNRC